MAYTIEHHQHRVAAWGAATAARASKLCRFKVHKGVKILEECQFTEAFSSPEQLPRPQELDQQHQEWRLGVIKAAEGYELKFTHGIAAKLINSYLKIRFVCAGVHEHERVRCLHPPIDAVLLCALKKQDFGGFKQQWRQFEELRWSKFDSATYQGVIDLMRKSLPEGAPLWTIEEHWKGHQ